MGTPLLQQIALKNNGVPLKKLRKLPTVFPLQFNHHYVINITRTTEFNGKEFARNN